MYLEFFTQPGGYMPKQHGATKRRQSALAEHEARACKLKSHAVPEPRTYTENQTNLAYAKAAMQVDILRAKLGKVPLGHRHIPRFVVDDMILAGIDGLLAPTVLQAREILELSTSVDELRLDFNLNPGTTEPLAEWMVRRAGSANPLSIGMIVLISGDPSGRKVLRDLLRHCYHVVEDQDTVARINFWAHKLGLPEGRDWDDPENRNWLLCQLCSGNALANQELRRLLRQISD
jgi:hypothetical protein